MLWELVSKEVKVWTVGHVPAAESVSTCQLSTTLTIHDLTAHTGREVKPCCLHPQQKPSCGGAVPCCVPLCPGLNKTQILLDAASVHGCAHFCPSCWVDFPSKAKLVVPAAVKDYGLRQLPFACACPTGSADGSDTKPALPQPLSCSRVSFTPGPFFLLSESHLPMLACLDEYGSS